MLKIKDLKDKKIIYKWDSGDGYYWDEKYIVEVDANHYALINMQGSYSGWISFNLESVDVEFISAFFNVYDGDFEKVNEVFDFSSNLEYEPSSGGSEVILIKKELIEPYLVEKIEE